MEILVTQIRCQAGDRVVRLYGEQQFTVNVKAVIASQILGLDGHKLHPETDIEMPGAFIASLGADVFISIHLQRSQERVERQGAFEAVIAMKIRAMFPELEPYLVQVRIEFVDSVINLLAVR